MVGWMALESVYKADFHDYEHFGYTAGITSSGE
jgi:hypothetical protein